MIGSVKRNVLLLAAFLAVAAGVLLFNSRRVASTAGSDAEKNERASAHFATLRSAHHPTAEQLERQEREQGWQQALDQSDRCSAMAERITSTETAQQAMQWARGLDDDAKQKSAVDAILCAWLKVDPQAAVGWATNADESASGRAFAVTSVFENWAARDAKAASVAAETLEQGPQTYAIVAVAPALTAQNPQEAIQWAQKFAEEDARNLATHGVVEAWASSAPSDAAAWVANQSEGFDRADDVRAVVQRWMESDLNAAIQWVATLPAGTSRDGAFDAIANRLNGRDASVAVQWGEAIGRPELRDSRLGVIAGSWFNTDPEAARNWLDKSSLPNDVKLRLTSPNAPTVR